MPTTIGTPSQNAAAGVWNTAVSNGTFGGKTLTTDPLDQTIDPNTFLARYPATPRRFGETIGPLSNVFSLDPVAYAKGRDKEERAHWSETVPLGQTFGVDLGDIVALTYRNDALQINWVSKLFQIVDRSMTITPNSFGSVVRMVEVDPDDGLAGGGGGNSPGGSSSTPPSAPSSLAVWSAANAITATSVGLQFALDGSQGNGDQYDAYANGEYRASFGANTGQITGLLPATTYSIYVKARNVAGQSSPASNTISVTTNAS